MTDNIEQLMEQGKYDEVLSLVQGDDQNSRLVRAFVLMKAGRLNEALKELEGLEVPEASYLRFEIYRGLGDKEKAAKEAMKLLEGREDDNLANYFVAQYFYDGGNLEEALRHIDRALAVVPHSYEYKKLKAKILFDLGDYEGASVVLTDLLAMNPKDVEARKMKAMCYYNLGLRMDALAEINKALDVRKDDVELRVLKAKIYYETGFYKLALSDFKAALRLRPNDPDIAYSVAACYYHIEMYREAEEYVNMALRLSEKGEYLALKALIKKAEGDTKSAKELAKRAVQLEPSTKPKIMDLLTE
ncbi:MAG: tetratricopeptide repeat protein [Sulfolobaceae archaeon]|nr:tetratricopeptide repeat protein [Sulfolobales archaeon]